MPKMLYQVVMDNNDPYNEYKTIVYSTLCLSDANQRCNDLAKSNGSRFLYYSVEHIELDTETCIVM